MLAIFIFLGFSLPSEAQLIVDDIEGTMCNPEVLAVEDGQNYPWQVGDFYLEASGVEPDCWRHEHPNGIDSVYIPGVWGRSEIYAERARFWIRSAYEAIEVTRSTVDDFQGPLEKPISVFILFDLTDGDFLYIGPEGERVRRAPAFTMPHRANTQRCVVGYFGREKIDPVDLVGDDLDVFKYYLAHEIAHCYHLEKLNEPTEETHWVMESFANFVATLAYPASNVEHGGLRKFDLRNRDFRQPYRAFVLFEHIQKTEGLPVVWDTVSRLFADTSGNNHMAIIDSVMSFHDFVLEYAYEGMPDPGGCDDGPCDYPLWEGYDDGEDSYHYYWNNRYASSREFGPSGHSPAHFQDYIPDTDHLYPSTETRTLTLRNLAPGQVHVVELSPWTVGDAIFTTRAEGAANFNVSGMDNSADARASLQFVSLEEGRRFTNLCSGTSAPPTFLVVTHMSSSVLPEASITLHRPMNSECACDVTSGGYDGRLFNCHPSCAPYRAGIEPYGEWCPDRLSQRRVP